MTHSFLTVTDVDVDYMMESRGENGQIDPLPGQTGIDIINESDPLVSVTIDGARVLASGEGMSFDNDPGQHIIHTFRYAFSGTGTKKLVIIRTFKKIL